MFFFIYFFFLLFVYQKLQMYKMYVQLNQTSGSFAKKSGNRKIIFKVSNQFKNMYEGHPETKSCLFAK